MALEDPNKGDEEATWVPSSNENPKLEEKEAKDFGKKTSCRPPKPHKDKNFKSFAIDAIQNIAKLTSDQPLQNFDPSVWAVLTAISAAARKRPQGVNILLNADEHYLGRLVEDSLFQIENAAVSANHCKIYRKKADDGELASTSCCFFLKDTSTNGTYLNWEKIRRNRPEAEIKHGDIISFVSPPDNELSLAFVFREVDRSVRATVLKRKSEEFVSESKRLKGLGIGSPEGPISLDDVRSLQKSNTDLRKQLESHVHTIETMRSETRAATLRHENEIKELKESISQSYLDQIKELQITLEVKQNELAEVSTISSERQQAMEDLNERLSASIQSRADADEIIQSQKAAIAELEVQLDEERNLRKEEREKAAADFRAALQRAQLEVQEEIKRQADAAFRQQREQQEIISKLQESDKESRMLVETLRSKLESSRESFVASEKKVRQLEAQLHEAQLLAANGKKKAEKMESEVRRFRKELESEKVAREEAWAKVSALELEIAASIRDLDIEKQRFQGARERIILRETQLRAFYSTTDEISALFAKQQEQLKAMRRTLEDEENYENTSVDIDLNAIKENLNVVLHRGREAYQRSIAAREASGASTPKNIRTDDDSTSDSASATEKHDCDMGTQEDGCTQDAECSSEDPSAKGFGSYIGTEPGQDGADAVGTEQVLGTQSEAVDTGSGDNIGLRKCTNLDDDTMRLDDEAEENGEQRQIIDSGDDRCSQVNNRLEGSKAMEDTEGGTIRTADLLASEALGSWAISTAPSVHGENESPRSGDHAGVENENGNENANATNHCYFGEAAGSQTVGAAFPDSRLTQERQALNAMIQIVAPEFKGQFESEGNDERMSNGDTKEGSCEENDDDDEASMGKDKEALSDTESKESRERCCDDDKEDNADYEEDETQQDSVE